MKKTSLITLVIAGLMLTTTLFGQPIKKANIGVNFWNRSWATTEKPWQTGVNMATGSGTTFWNPVFIEQVNDFTFARFMDWMVTNNSTLKTWSNRPAKTSTNPIAYEHWIDLCNTANTNLWICLPAQVISSTSTNTNDFVQKLAILVKTGVDMKTVDLNTLGDLSVKTQADFIAAGGTKTCNPLNSNLKVYIEYSNETWNNMFSQTAYCFAEGNKLNLKILNTATTAGNRFSMWASFKMFEAFQNVYGAANMGTKIIRVLCGQGANEWLTNNVILPGINDVKVNPNNTGVDAVSISNYFSRLPGASADPTTEAELIEAATIMTNPAMKIAPNLALRNIPLIAYEGGIHWNTSNPPMDQLPVMYDAIRTMLHVGSAYYETMAQYTLTGGIWGCMRNTDDPLSVAHKYRAIVHYLDTLNNHYVPDVTPPAAPTQVTITKLSSTDIAFTIKASTDDRFLKFYKVYVNNVLTLYKNWNDLDVVLNALTPATTYNFKITAIDAEGNESTPFLFSKATRELLPDINVKLLPSEIVLDGAIDAAWGSVTAVPMGKVVINKQSDYTVTPSDLSGFFKIGYTASKLYFMAEITDDVNLTSQQGVDCIAPYNDDCFEMYLDMGNEKASSYDANDDHIGFLLVPGSNITCYKKHYNPPFKAVYANGKYIIEGSYSWSELGKTPTPGLKFGVEMQMNDDDDDLVDLTKRDHKLAWYYQGDVATADPSTFGTAFLSLTESGAIDFSVNEVINNACGISLTPATFSFTTAAASKTMSVALNGTCASGVKSVSTTDAWITPSISGNTITVAVSANSSAIRTGSVKLKVDGVEMTSIPVNQAGTALNTIPTITALPDLDMNVNAGLQTVNLAGIADGDGGIQTITITGSSSWTELIPSVNVNYTSGSTGTLTFTPAAGKTGYAIITVTVKDNGGTAGGGVDSKVISFRVNVNGPATGVECETATVRSATDVKNESVQLNYTGTGYVNMPNVAGSYIEWTITAAKAGKYDLNFKYAASTARPGTISINGGTAVDVPFEFVNSSWDVWGKAVVSPVTLNAGANTIRITSANGPNLDSFTYSETLVTMLNNVDFAQVKVYPNPVKDILNIDGLNTGEVSVFNFSGVKVKSELISGIQSVINLQDLPQGLYMVRLTSDNKLVRTIKIAKQ